MKRLLVCMLSAIMICNAPLSAMAMENSVFDMNTLETDAMDEIIENNEEYYEKTEIEFPEVIVEEMENETSKVKTKDSLEETESSMEQESETVSTEASEEAKNNVTVSEETPEDVSKEEEIKENIALSYLSYKLLDDGTIGITDCDSSVIAISIPDIIDDKPVTAICDSAFYWCQTDTE